MNIIYASDNAFTSILAVSIMSLCKYNPNVNIIVLDNEINDENKGLLRRIVDVHTGCSITFVEPFDLNNWKLKNLNADRGSLAQFSRLFIRDRVPKEWKRVLYLDCDTLVNDSLQELFDWDLKENIIGAVEDAFSAFNKRILGLGKKDILINSGVMLIDLQLWKKYRIEEKIEKLMIKKKGKIMQGDQGIINTVLHNNIMRLPVKYNVVSYNYDFSYENMVLYRKPTTYYTKEEVLEAVEHPVIVHFTSSFASMRPWQTSQSCHPFFEKWSNYYKELNFSKKCISPGSTYKMYTRLQSKLTLRVIGIVHSYIRPLFKM